MEQKQTKKLSVLIKCILLVLLTKMYCYTLDKLKFNAVMDIRVNCIYLIYTIIKKTIYLNVSCLEHA